ncbi:MAG: hypothetical protein FWE41_05670 [Coriobacteriia bacterium]|nr:hypothetical protein [Coriobacteriia bacterium]MCL2750190.1 hypothetical protein [Coriobacteriia bacterium]
MNEVPMQEQELQQKKPKKKPKKKLGIIIGIAAVLGIVALIIILVIANSEPAPEPQPFDTIEQFAAAYSNHDYGEIIECFDPRVTKIVQNIISGVAGFFGIPKLDSVAVGLIGGLLGGFAKDNLPLEEVTGTMTVKEISTVMDDKNKAVVTVEFTIVHTSGQSDTWYENISMVKRDDKWYITFEWGNLTSLYPSSPNPKADA